MPTVISKDPKKMQLLKDVFFKTASQEEFELFAHACERSGLDPFMKQIYPVKRWDSTLKREAMTIQTGIDGYRLIAERTGRYAPGKEPMFEYDSKGKLFKATAFVKKRTDDGIWHEVPAFAYFDEYCQKTKDGSPTSMWMKMPHSQLAKCAEALALRKAFPAECSGIYTKEEMDQAELVVDVEKIKEPEKIYISHEHAMELESLLSDCDETYVQNVRRYYLQNYKIDSWEKLTTDLYTPLYNNISKQISRKSEMEGAA